MAVDGYLLPSEIARLVYGYLKGENCDSAAASLLKDSLHLQECYNVFLRGGKFSTRVSNLSLIDIVNKFCELSELVEEKWNEIPESDRCKISSTDFLEQVRYLLECRKQRFVVGVNVPTQTSSPEVSAKQPKYCHKRNHSTSSESDHFQSKRMAQSTIEDGPPSEPIQGGSNRDIQATLLENLPGHIGQRHTGKPKCLRRMESTFRQEEDAINQDTEQFERCNAEIHSKNKVDAFSQVENAFILCPKPEATDKIVQILSLLSKELLNCSEIHQRIADYITETFSDVTPKGDTANIRLIFSIEWKEALDKIIEKIENDPKFVEILNKVAEMIMINYSSEEESKAKGDSGFTDEEEENEMDTDSSHNTSTESSVDPLLENTGSLDQDNRDSQTLQNAEDDKNPTDEPKDWEKVLEDQNAAAVMSIINAVTETSVEVKETSTKTISEPVVSSKNVVQASSSNEQEKTNKSTDKNYAYSNITTSTPFKINEAQNRNHNTAPEWFSEKEMMEMPVIMCSKEDAATMVKENNTPKSNKQLTDHTTPLVPFFSPFFASDCQLKTPDSFNFQSFIQASINPCDSSKIVTPPCIITRVPINGQSKLSTNIERNTAETVTSCSTVNEQCNNFNVESPILHAACTVETLNHIKTPAFGLSESLSLLNRDLSPFLKIIGKPIETTEVKTVEPIAKATVEAPAEAPATVHEEQENLVSTSLRRNSDVIEKLTPKTLLKMRSQNHRLSLSTPRKTTSHRRALNFNTPLNKSLSEKEMSSAALLSSDNLKRRKSLFKSPPYSGSQGKKPKLDEAATEKPVNSEMPFIDKESAEVPKPVPLTKSIPKKSWDEDLRKKFNCLVEKSPEKPKPKPRNRRQSMKKGTKTLKNEEQTSGVKEKDRGKENKTEIMKPVNRKEKVDEKDAKVTKRKKIKKKSPVAIASDASVTTKVSDAATAKKDIKAEKNYTKTVESNMNFEKNKKKVQIDYKKIEAELERLTSCTDNNATVASSSGFVKSATGEIEGRKIEEDGGKFAEIKTSQTTISNPVTNETNVKELFFSDYSLPVLDLNTPNKLETLFPTSKTSQFVSSNSIAAMPIMRCNENTTRTPLINLSPETKIAARTAAKNAEESTYFEPSTSEEIKKTEITQFEVIKENLPKIKNIQNVSNVSTESNKTDPDTSNFTSSSDSSSNSSSSSSYSSHQEDEKRVEECRNLTTEINSMMEICEASPEKVFAIEKTDKAIENTVKETPLKEDNSCVEVDIFETPSSSKAGIENSTNLTSKITEHEASRANSKFLEPSKPRIVSITQHIPPVIIQRSQNGIRRKSGVRKEEAVTQKNEKDIEVRFEKEDRSEKKTSEAAKKTNKTENAAEGTKDSKHKSSKRKSIKSSSNGNPDSQTDPEMNDSMSFNIAQNQPAILMTYVETDEKKRRRKKFSDADLVCHFNFSDEKKERGTCPSKYEVLFNMNPDRKNRKAKVMPKKNTASVITTKRIKSNFNSGEYENSESKSGESRDEQP